MTWVAGSLTPQWASPTIFVGGGGGNIFFYAYQPLTSAGAGMADNTGAGAVAVASSCGPLHWQSHTSSVPTQFAYWLNHGGVTDLYIDDSDPTVTGSCDVTVTVTGCNSQALPGATVDIYAGGPLLATGTTNASGIFVFNASILPAFGFTTVTSLTRFTTDTSAWNISGNEFAASVALAPASGFSCLAGCVIPLSNTLHVTFSIAGAKTLTNSGSNWTVSFSASGHAYVLTITPIGAITITRDGTSCGAVTWTITACPTAFAATIAIPAGACATELGSSATMTE